MKCDTEEDRNAWIEALLAAKDRFPRSLTANDLDPMADIMVSTEKLRTRLLQEGLNETVVKECESIMMSELLELHNQIKSQQQQHSILIDRLRQMEVAFYLLFVYFMPSILMICFRKEKTSRRKAIFILFSEVMK